MTNSRVNPSSSIYGHSKPGEPSSEAPFYGASTYLRRPYCRNLKEAVVHGNLVLTLAGILVSIVGVARILYLVASRKNEKNPL
jgi:hypothetical protein